LNVVISALKAKRLNIMAARLRVALGLLMILFSNMSIATHVVGGDFTYRWLSGNRFELTLKIYRDCLPGNAGFDQSIVIGIFDLVTHSRQDTLVMKLTGQDFVGLSGPSASCNIPPEVCVEYAIYRDTIFIPDNPNGYYLIWERCCRNSTISNMQNPLQTGMAFYAEMPDPALHNSSPQFSNDPLPFVCENQPLNYSFAAMDPDGDVLVYELSTPLAGNTGLPNNMPVQAILPTPLPAPYPPVSWAPGYSLANVCQSTPALSVNPVTGLMSVTVQNLGMYAMAVTVKEYRNGMLIGLIRREIEFSVIVCLGSIPQLSLAPNIAQTGTNYFEIYEGDTITLLITGTDTEDSLWLKVESETMQGGSVIPPYATAGQDSGMLYVASFYQWNTQCGHARSEPYKIEISLLDNGCPLPFTTTDSVFIKVKSANHFKPDVVCIGLREGNKTEVIWQAPDVPPNHFQKMEVYRSVNGSAFSLIGIQTDYLIHQFTDQYAYDYLNNNYCYFVKLISDCGGGGPPSDTVCSADQFNNSVNRLKSASVVNNQAIEIQWQPFWASSNSSLFIYRAENNPSSSYELIATLVHPAGLTYTDQNVKVNKTSYCYYLINEDYCGNRSNPGNRACTVFLEGESDMFFNKLKWNAYQEWNQGVNRYQVYRRPYGSGLPFSLIASTEYTDTFFSDYDLDPDYGYYDYRITAIEDTLPSPMQSVSNEITLSQQPVGYLPNTFTPNQDGKNDVWKLESAFIESAEIKIFSRWGQLVYESSSKSFSWDGNQNGKPLPQGVYVYLLIFKGYGSEKKFSRTGTVTLLR
jgi:gliding motility-associated-like protein